MTNQEKVIAVASKWLRKPIEGFDLDALFEGDADLDSLDFVEVIMAIEDDFDISIPDEVAEQFKNMRDILNYVNAHCPEGRH